jgi:hypothetical protein
MRWSVIGSSLVAQAAIGQREQEQAGQGGEPEDVGHGSCPVAGARVAGLARQIGVGAVKVRRRMRAAGVKFA